MAIAHVTLRQLRAFEAAARLGGITRAAEELFLAQPTVSIQIRQLSDAVGLPLFEQIGKKMFLTDAGRELRDACREIFDSWSRFEMTVADLQGMKRGRLRLAVVSTAKYFVPRLLGPFCQRHPGIDVTLEVANRDSILERLADNRDDLYVMGLPPESLALHLHPFLENPLVVLAPAGHSLVGQRAIPVARLADEPFILRERGSGTRLAVEQFFREQGMAPRVRMEIATNEAVKQAVIGGLGLTVLSLHALGSDPRQEGLAVLDASGFPLRRSWFVVYPEGRQLSVVARTFFEHLRRAAGEIPVAPLLERIGAGRPPPVSGRASGRRPPPGG